MKVPKDWKFSHIVTEDTGFKEYCVVCGKQDIKPIYVYKDRIHNTRVVCEECHKDSSRVSKQTDLIEDFGFPKVPETLKLGEYKRKRDFTKTPEPEG
jgi:hypothetical protein